MRSDPRFLIFGISGVGKSTACERFAADHPEYLCARASTLLANAKHTNTESLRVASEDRIRATQRLLPPAFEEFRQRSPGRPALLDCHAVIDNDETLVEVPIEIIQALDPDGLLLLEAPPERVALQRERDDRKRPQRTLQQIRLELETERKAVTRYARVLGLPLERVEVTPDFSLEAPLHRLIARTGK